jgi:AbrB family looped-hinge helix DNA binding protein
MNAMPRYRAKMSAEGQLTIPAAVRKHLGLRPGDMVDFHVDDTDRSDTDRSVRIQMGNENISYHQEDLDMQGGLDEAAAEYVAPSGQVSRRSIFDHLDELKLPSIGRPVTQADIDAAIGEAMEEQERRIRNQRRP